VKEWTQLLLDLRQGLSDAFEKVEKP
jgi:hypothetical protein